MSARRIFKYRVPLPFGALEMPREGKIRAVQMQSGYPMMWVDLEPEMPTEVRHFETVSTGQPIPKGATYIGTYQENAYVWHVYEVKP